jgi:hypothetical protein
MNSMDKPLDAASWLDDHAGAAPAFARRGGAGRDRGVEVRLFPSTRRLVTAAVRAGRRIGEGLCLGLRPPYAGLLRVQ